MEISRWQNLMQNFGIADNIDTYQSLLDAYSQKHRRYHTGEHISATLRHLDAVADLADHTFEIEVALWFHDAIYKPFSAKNELDSADWAAKFLSNNGVSPDRISRVHRLIMATVHTAEIQSGDQQLMVDIDLSILGVPSAVYAQFEKNVRYEYRLVPYFLYKKKRKEILASFLARDKIYQSDYFFETCEAQARVNLAAAIDAL